MLGMFDWMGLPPAVFWWIAVGSAIMFVVALVATPVLVTRIPVDYFSHSHRSDAAYPRKHLWFRLVWLVLKNVVGVGLLFFGVLMLILPGQGVLTILIALMLLDFPGKFRLQRWVATRKGVLASINWIRRRRGVDPLEFDPSCLSGDG